MGALDDLTKELDAFRERLRGAGIEVGRSSKGGGGVARRGQAKERSAAVISGTAQTLTGGGAFVAVLALSQVFQGAVLRVSCSSPMGLPTVFGFVTVAAASVASLQVADSVARTEDKSRPAPQRRPSNGEMGDASLGASSFGLILYRALGGRFSSVAPSVLHMPGSFSRLSASLPATLEYASQEKRQALAALGKYFGCHTCGTRAPTTYIADHMPPLKTVKLANAALWRKVLRQTVSQRFYPQCQDCSTLQSSAVRSGVSTLKYHVSPEALRPHHLTGALLVLGTVMMQDRWRALSDRNGKRIMILEDMMGKGRGW